MRILFLDIDGVLNKDGVGYPDDDWPSGYVERACVRRLNRILAEADCELVLSSSWRLGRVGEVVQRMLDDWGVIKPLFDRVSDVDLPPGTPAEVRRAAEIADWIARNEASLGLSSWIAIDDLDLAGAVPQRRIDPETGLTDEDVVEIVEALVPRDVSQSPGNEPRPRSFVPCLRAPKLG